MEDRYPLCLLYYTIVEETIEPKDKLIKQLYFDTIKLHRELDKQVHIIDKASKHEKDYSSIIANNKELQEKYNTMEKDYSAKEEQEQELEWDM